MQTLIVIWKMVWCMHVNAHKRCKNAENALTSAQELCADTSVQTNHPRYIMEC